MPRGAYKFKPPKAQQSDASTPQNLSRTQSMPIGSTTPVKKDWRRAGIPMPAFQVRSLSKSQVSVEPVPPLPLQYRESPLKQDYTLTTQPETSDIRVDSEDIPLDPSSHEQPIIQNGLEVPEHSLSRKSSQVSLALSTGNDDGSAVDLDAFEDLAVEESAASSLYSKDSASIYSTSSSLYSKDSASIYSTSSSLYSSGASTYSFEDAEIDRISRRSSTFIAEDSDTFGSSLPSGLQPQHRARAAAIKRQEAQDAASRERSSLAKKAALYKNSRLSPDLATYTTSLPTWSMVCRAVHSSQDCYDSRVSTRQGNYTAADPSKHIKAMIIDDQFIDDAGLLIVSIRGTEFQSLKDWTVNKASNPEKPVGFLDDEENACHAGFLQVAKAMVSQVATQLREHPASSQKPSLLFTGHSAGGAVAAMLYNHMLSASVQSELVELSTQFLNINCITFGAPPLSLTPLLPKRQDRSGVFLAFANEGDPVLRLSNAAYVKSLAKLMTVSLPSVPTVKVVHRSRGTAVVRKTLLDVAPSVPWEELPLWPTPPAPLTNPGEVILLRDTEHGRAVASRVTTEDLDDVIFGDLAQHTLQMYVRRVNELALAAMTGRSFK